MELELDSLGLSAFLALCGAKNFSRAASSLHISQSALSQRIRRFEESMGSILVYRGTPSFSLTTAGMEVLSYGRRKKALLDDLRCKLNSARGPLSGTLRLGAFSSVLRSVIMPALSELFRTHSGMRAEYFSKEVFELPDMLLRGVIDIAVINYELTDPHIVKIHLFDEENVLIEPSEFIAPDVYLDHDPQDQTTFNFFKTQGLSHQRLERSFCDDIYGILDGVRLGMGRAVAPIHLVRQSCGIRVVPDLQVVKSPVFAHLSPHYGESYFIEQIMAKLKASCRPYLEGRVKSAKIARSTQGSP